MKLEHLISTMYQTDMSFLDEMGCCADILVANQTDRSGQEEQSISGIRRRMISTVERGLSNSRNMLLDYACGDVCIFGDDDLLYLPGYNEKIENAYQKHQDADIIIFSFTQSLDCFTRRQYDKARRMNIFNISKAASVEITFKLKSVKKAKVRFCPELGLGAKYGACEENAFLADALRAGLKIWYEPETICYLKPDPPERVKWKDGFDKDYFIKRGAGFYRIYKNWFLPFSLAFLLLKRNVVLNQVHFFSALRYMRKGKKDFIKETK